jgi:hypothetical protein
MSRALYCLGEFTLVLGTDVGVLRVYDFRLAGNKTPKKIDFFIIDFIHILGTEEALFNHSFRV